LTEPKVSAVDTFGDGLVRQGWGERFKFVNEIVDQHFSVILMDSEVGAVMWHESVRLLVNHSSGGLDQALARFRSDAQVHRSITGHVQQSLAGSGE